MIVFITSCYTGPLSLTETYVYKNRNLLPLEKALKKNHNNITALVINEYSDTVFPNSTLLKFKNLEQLRIECRSHNKKTEKFIPLKLTVDTAALKQFSHLKHLEIVRFDLRDFPEELFQLTQLKSLCLGMCGMDSLPSSVKNLQQLEVLMLRINNLSSLPRSLKNLENLTTLDLCNNSFTVFPNILTEMNNLKYCYFHNAEGLSNSSENFLFHNYFPLYNNRFSFTEEKNIETLSSIIHLDSLIKTEIGLYSCDDVMKLKEKFAYAISQKKMGYSCFGCSANCPYLYNK